MKADGKENYYPIHFQRKQALLNKILGTKDQKLNFVYSIIVISLIVAVYVLYKEYVWTNVTCFWVSTLLIIVRVVAFVVDKLSQEDIKTALIDKRNPKTAKIIFALMYGLICFFSMIMFNLVYDFRLWTVMGLTGNLWMNEVAISINTILATLIVLGIIVIFDNREGFAKIEMEKMRFDTLKERLKYHPPKEIVQIRQQKKTLMMATVLLIIVPLMVAIITIPLYQLVSDIQYEGLLNGTTYQPHNPPPLYDGQAIDDWFSYVFFILFQAPVPLFMLAFMSIGSVAVILAQNQANVGRTITGVAVGVISIVPMFIVVMAIGGSIPPPPELIEIIGLSEAIAGFIYGMGLILTYIIAISIMGVFISASKILQAGW